MVSQDHIGFQLSNELFGLLGRSSFQDDKQFVDLLISHSNHLRRFCSENSYVDKDRCDQIIEEYNIINQNR